MKKQKQTYKSSFFKKLFIKLCRLFDFEIIDQNKLFLPVSEKKINNNLSKLGKESLVVPMGRISINRPVKSLDIILRTCSSVNMLSQSKKRIMGSNKKDYTLKTLQSIINSINNNKQLFKRIKLKLTIIDHNSPKDILIKFKKILNKQFKF